LIPKRERDFSFNYGTNPACAVGDKGLPYEQRDKDRDIISASSATSSFLSTEIGYPYQQTPLKTNDELTTWYGMD
jgi:hypothetical protein